MRTWAQPTKEISDVTILVCTLSQFDSGLGYKIQFGNNHSRLLTLAFTIINNIFFQVSA